MRMMIYTTRMKVMHDNTTLYYTSSLLTGSYPPPDWDIANLRRYAGHPIYQLISYPVDETEKLTF